jgi:hypothetical protein
MSLSADLKAGVKQAGNFEKISNTLISNYGLWRSIWKSDSSLKQELIFEIYYSSLKFFSKFRIRNSKFDLVSSLMGI